LGILAVIWYLYVYTLLKRKSAFATIPGALTGALPLLIGWVAAGGYVFDRYIIISSLFVFIWQIPHFWILMMVYGNDYQKAGFPVLTETFSFRNLKLWTLAWIVVLVVQASLLPIFLEISLNFTQILFIIPSIITLFYSSLKLLNEKNTEKRSLMPVFHILNSFMLLIVILLMVFRE
jgi:protoheme IX farnesyltransferase